MHFDDGGGDSSGPDMEIAKTNGGKNFFEFAGFRPGSRHARRSRGRLSSSTRTGPPSREGRRSMCGGCWTNADQGSQVTSLLLRILGEISRAVETLRLWKALRRIETWRRVAERRQVLRRRWP